MELGDGANFYDYKYKGTSTKIVGKLKERIRKLEGGLVQAYKR